MNATLKEQWEQHPIRWITGLVVSVFILGFAAGSYWDESVARYTGRIALTEQELVDRKATCMEASQKVDSLKAELTDASDRSTDQKTLVAELTSLRKQLTTATDQKAACPNLECPKCPTVPHQDSPLSEANTQSQLDKICISATSVLEVSNQFEEYGREKNEKISNDRFRGNWICDPGWLLQVAGVPTKDREAYWNVVATEISDESLPAGVSSTLKVGQSALGLKDGDWIRVKGRISRASAYQIDLREATWERASRSK